MDPLSTSKQIGRMLRRGNWGHIYNNNYRVNWLLHNSAGGELMVGSSGLCAGAAKTWSSPATWKKSKKKQPVILCRLWFGWVKLRACNLGYRMRDCHNQALTFWSGGRVG